MTSNVKRHVQLPRSSQKGKVPTADDLKYGEIAVNFNKEEPFIAIKGSDDSIITMDFKNAEKGPWNKGEGEHSAVLGNETSGSPTEIINTATGKYATAEGNGTTASGNNSHSEGLKTNAIGNFSHVEGAGSSASGLSSHAEGTATKAVGNSSHAEGKSTTASGPQSHAEGISTTARGESSHAEGSATTASGENSHTEGINTTASGPQSHAEGNYTTARGENSHAEGYKTDANGNHSHAEGNYTTASGDTSHAEGNYTIVKGGCSHAEGKYMVKMQLAKDIAVGDTKITVDNDAMNLPVIDEYIKNCFIRGKNNPEDIYNIVSYSTDNLSGVNVIEFTLDKPLETASSNSGSYDDYHSFTSNEYILTNIAVGEVEAGHAEGKNNIVLGEAGHAEGIMTIANGDYSHAEGYSNTASGECSHAEGSSTIASGAKSHTEGVNTKAVGNFSHAEGSNTNSAAHYSHVEGSGGIALSVSSHVEGLHLNGLQITDDITAGSTEMFILASEDYSVNLDYYKNCIIANNDRTSAIDVLNAEYAYNTKFTADNENKRIKLTLKDPLPKACTRAAQITGNQRDGYFYTWEYTIQNKGTIESYGSHAEGSYTMVYEDAGHAEGKLSISKGKISHAEGYRTIAGGKYSHSEGINTTASGESSHAEGSNTTASGKDSHASGLATLASNQSEFACGQYNKANTNQIFSVGIGTADNARKNAIYITTDGSISGDVQLTNGGTSMTGLKILGGIQATNGMIAPTYLNSSDERLKKDIETISENDIDKVKNVDLKSYAFKSDNSKHFGVIAQDVERAGLEELVVSSTEGIKSVDYISLLILKIAELENEIKNLKEQIKK